MVAKYHRISVEEPFRSVPGHDAQHTRATLEAADSTRRLVLKIPGPRHPRRGTSSESAWQDAMGLLTLLELARWNVADLPSQDGAELILHLLDDVSPEEWDGVGVESFVRQRLPDYVVSRTTSGWQATNYAQHLKKSLAKDLVALKCGIPADDILVKERPDGDYDVEVRVRTERRQTPQGVSFDVGPVVKETYTVDEALETKGDAYREKTIRLAQTIKEIPGSP